MRVRFGVPLPGPFYLVGGRRCHQPSGDGSALLGLVMLALAGWVLVALWNWWTFGYVVTGLVAGPIAWMYSRVPQWSPTTYYQHREYNSSSMSYIW